MVKVVIVAFVAVRVVKNAEIPERIVEKKLDEVAFVALKVKIVPEEEVRSLIVALAIVDVAKVEVPVTTKVLVVVALLEVREVITADTAVRSEEKKPVVEVALVVEALVALRVPSESVVPVPLVKERAEVLRLLEVAFVVMSEVNVGVEDTAMVEVEESTMLDPAVKKVAGAL